MAYPTQPTVTAGHPTCPHTIAKLKAAVSQSTKNRMPRIWTPHEQSMGARARQCRLRTPGAPRAGTDKNQASPVARRLLPKHVHSLCQPLGHPTSSSNTHAGSQGGHYSKHNTSNLQAQLCTILVAAVPANVHFTCRAGCSTHRHSLVPGSHTAQRVPGHSRRPCPAAAIGSCWAEGPPCPTARPTACCTANATRTAH
jgi:hypothetical protein